MTANCRRSCTNCGRNAAKLTLTLILVVLCETKYPQSLSIYPYFGQHVVPRLGFISLSSAMTVRHQVVLDRQAGFPFPGSVYEPGARFSKAPDTFRVHKGII